MNRWADWVFEYDIIPWYRRLFRRRPTPGRSVRTPTICVSRHPSGRYPDTGELLRVTDVGRLPST